MNQDFSSYRTQRTVIDFGHIALIFMVVLLQLWFAVKYHQTGDRWYAAWIPVLTISCLGLLARLDTMVKRMDGWLAKMGDPWEQALNAHVPTKYLMPGADFLVFSVVLVLLIYAEIEAAPYFSSEPLKPWHVFSPRRWYQIGTLGGVALGVLWWILAALKAKTGF